jgi:electron transfer flavoprotein alpha subunit
MKNVFIIAEHREGELKDITWELISGGRELASKTGGSLTALLLGHGVDSMAHELSKGCDKVVVMGDPKLEHFNSELYLEVLSSFLTGETPFLIMMGHSSMGMDLAPEMAVRLDLPLATDCIGLEYKEDRLFAIRQLYSSKINARISFAEAGGYLVTMRPGAFQAIEDAQIGGEVISLDSPLTEGAKGKVFIEYEAAEAGDVDISQADIIVAVGRGLGDEENIPQVESLAEVLGGVVACSRPVVDKKWLPKYRQVGTSGVTVKPKLYMALGISGTFQHMGGVKGSPVVVAINKDKNAPIFRIANYGIVDDLFKVIPLIEEKVKELKGTG